MRKKWSLRPQVSTFIVGCAAICFFAVTALPGELLSPTGGNFGGGYWADYEHGWPLVWMQRRYRYDFSSPSMMFPDVPICGVPWLALDSWKVWEASAVKLSVTAMVVDCTVIFASLGLVFGLVEWLRRNGVTLFRFNLRSLLAGITLMAAFGAWWAGWRSGATVEAGQIKACAKIATLQESYGYFGPLWLRRLVGKDILGDAFDRVHAVTLEAVDRDKLHDMIPHLEQLSQLSCLRVYQQHPGGQAIPADRVPRFSELARLKRLRFLVLSRHIGKSGVSELAKLIRIEEIAIRGPAWDDALPLTLVRLQGALPDCRVVEKSTYSSPSSNYNYFSWDVEE